MKITVKDFQTNLFKTIFFVFVWTEKKITEEYGPFFNMDQVRSIQIKLYAKYNMVEELEAITSVHPSKEEMKNFKEGKTDPVYEDNMIITHIGACPKCST